MNDRLNEILKSINGFYYYNDDVPREYIFLINEAVELIRGIEAKPTSLLDNAKSKALTELSNELANRMNDNFFQVNHDRRKNDFKISKMLVVVALSDVLSNLTSVEPDSTDVE